METVRRWSLEAPGSFPRPHMFLAGLCRPRRACATHARERGRNRDRALTGIAGEESIRPMRTRLAVLALAVVVAVLVAPSAAAYSGAITRAHANDTWTRGSIAGYVDWTDCGSDPCSWLPIATVQPVLPAYGCRGDEALDSDPNTRNVWNGGGRTANGTATFDLADVPILSGVHGQRLCLSVS
jgi:hypothetical protein